MGELKCEISQKRLIVEQNGRKFGTRGTTVQICRAVLMPDSACLVWGHSMHFEKFPIPRFSKHYSFNSFHQISTKLHTSIIIGVNIGYYFFLAVCQKLKILWHFQIFVNTGPYGAGISKRYSSYSFHLMLAKLYEDIGLPWENTGYHFSWQSA